MTSSFSKMPLIKLAVTKVCSEVALQTAGHHITDRSHTPNLVWPLGDCASTNHI